MELSLESLGTSVECVGSDPVGSVIYELGTTGKGVGGLG